MNEKNLTFSTKNKELDVIYFTEVCMIHKRTTNVAMNRDRHLANAGLAKKERQNTVGFEDSSFTVMVDPSFVL